MKERTTFATLLAVVLALLIFTGDLGAQGRWDHQLWQSDGREARQQQPADATATPRPSDSEVDPQIIGGEEAVPGAWPWIAALVDSRYDNAFTGWYCGGTLIRPNWVLTAAHCTYGYNDLPKPPSAIDVVLGRHQLSNPGGERIAVAEIIRHPNYDSATFDFDLALLRLSQPSSYEPLSLVPAEDSVLSAAGVTSTVIGWGDTRSNGSGSYSDVLRQVSLPIVSNETCNSYSSYAGEITENMLCAGYAEGGKDACAGDSGGPLMVPDLEGGWVQAGIVSWGYDCALPNYYGVYTRVSRFTHWINTQIGSVIIATPTPTDTTAPTATPSSTATPTPSTSPTPTATFTATATASATPTSTATATGSASPTATPSVTATPTSTPLPKEISGVRISNLRDSSFSVSWLSAGVSTGELFIASTPGDLASNPQIVQSVGSGRAHWATVTGLTPQSAYFFYIRSGDQIDDNKGAYYQAITGPVLALPPSDNIYGQVYEAGEEPAENCTVLVEVVDGDGLGSEGASGLLSTSTDSDGYWSLNLGNARTQDRQNYFLYSASGDWVAVEVQCEPQRGVGLMVDTADDYPLPAMTVRQLALHTLPLHNGWNLISLPAQPVGRVTAEQLCADLKAASSGIPVEIVRWSTDGWDGYVCGVAANNFDLQSGAAYFVRQAGPGVWKVTGSALDTSNAPPFQLGWNGVNAAMWGSNTAADLCSVVTLPDQGVEVNRWYASGWEGHICGLGFNNFALTAGNGYFLKVAAGSSANDRGVRAIPPMSPIEGDPVSEMRVTNLRDGSVAISWLTEQAARGSVTYSVEGQLAGMRHDLRGETFEDRVHYVVLTDLAPDTTYTFTVDSPGNDGSHSRGEGHFTTFSTSAAIPRSQSAYGRVLFNDQTPAAGMLVFLTIIDADGQGSSGRSLALSTLTDGNGWWYANFGNARAESGDPFRFEGEDQVEISVVQADQPLTIWTIPVATSFPATTIQLADHQIYAPMISR